MSTLVNYIVGVGGQNAVNARVAAAGESREAFLDTVASHWEDLDPGEHPLVRRLTSQLRVHDDREEFLAGIDIIVTGLTATR